MTVKARDFCSPRWACNVSPPPRCTPATHTPGHCHRPKRAALVWATQGEKGGTGLPIVAAAGGRASTEAAAAASGGIVGSSAPGAVPKSAGVGLPLFGRVFAACRRGMRRVQDGGGLLWEAANVPGVGGGVAPTTAKDGVLSD